MVKPFEEAVFGAELIEEKSLLLPEVIKTDFGFHVIEVLELRPEVTQTKKEPKIAYEILGWKLDEFAWEKTELDGSKLEISRVGVDQVGSPTVDLLFNNEGGEIFGRLTKRIAAKKCQANPCRLGIKIGERWISQPTVTEEIRGNTAQITGRFTFDSAKALSDSLNLGAIPAPVKLSGETSVAPELGKIQLEKSLKAGVLGILMTMLFMIFRYRMGGLVASLSLGLYGLLMSRS